MKFILEYLKLILVAILVTIIIDGILHNLFSELYLKGSHNTFILELPILIFASFIFYFQKIKSIILRYIFATSLILISYSIFDIFYQFLGRSPVISDLYNFSAIYHFSPILYFSIIIGISALLLFYAYIINKFNNGKKDIIIKLFGMIFFVMLLSSDFYFQYQKSIFKFISWSQKYTIRANGRIASFIYFSKLEQENRKNLQFKNSDINISNILYPDRIKNKQNIYFVVLESFINPNYIQDLNFSRNPLAEELIPYLNNGDFSHIISPIYGGGTAQAEFEVLSGIPALATVGSIEFNTLQGSEIESFVHQVKSNGYQTMATIATDSGYFNSKTAYKSLGFEKVIFLESEKEFTRNINDKRIFDGDIFTYNLENLKKSNKPIFNYVLGMYGHLPYSRNLKDRKDEISIQGISSDSEIHRITNQFYYRTKAIAKYISDIISCDSNAIIFISADHLPPVLTTTIKYKFDKYQNISILINRGKVIKNPLMHQYEVPWLVWDLLTKPHKRDLNNSELEKLYYKALNESLN